MIASMVPEVVLDAEVGKTCKRSRRLIEKWRDAAVMTNIAAKKQP
jgi:hypothetical protein